MVANYQVLECPSFQTELSLGGSREAPRPRGQRIPSVGGEAGRGCPSPYLKGAVAYPERGVSGLGGVRLHHIHLGSRGAPADTVTLDTTGF